MAKCIIAQSGGPSSVINATLAGIIKANQLNPVYGRVLGGINGIEGILQERFVDLTKMTEYENLVLRQTPSSALGACRYKLKRDNLEDFEKIMKIMEKYDVETLFYIGGNDSMDTVASLSEYAARNKITNRRFVGCPKTIDNDLEQIDHAPGFPSAAKFIATTALQCWQDINVYPASRKEVFIMETMGRDAGWLAASACLSGIVDILIVPEKNFDREIVLEEIADVIEKKSKCFVVISEGAHYSDGTYVSANEARSDLFGHAVLGGACRALQQMILDAGICQRCRIMDLSSSQRCHATEQSNIDVNESFRLGLSAHMRSQDPSFTGKMVSLKRRTDVEEYDVEFTAVDADRVANFVRNVPGKWLLDNYRGITEEALAYMRPLIKGTPKLLMKDGLPEQTVPFYMRDCEIEKL